MFNLIRAHCFSLSRARTTWLLFAASVVCALVMLLFLKRIGASESSLGGIAFFFSDLNVVTLIGAVLATLLISNDFDNRTMQHTISAGHSRAQIVTSKFIVYWLFMCLYLLPFVAASFWIFYADAPYTFGVPMGGMISAMNSTTQISTAVALLLCLVIVYVGQTSLAVMLAFFLKKPTFVIVLFYAISVLCGQLAANNLNWLNWTPFGGDAITVTADSSLLAICLVSLRFISICVGITILYFRKTDIH